MAYTLDYWEGDQLVRRELVVLDPAAPDAPRVVLSIDGYTAMPFVWLDAEHLIVATASAIERVGLDGTREVIARPEGLVDFFYESPDGRTLAYTQSDAAGWRLFTLDLETSELIDRGNMGSDPAGIQPPDVNSTDKGPMYVEWSPDGRQIGFGGGYSEPFFMTMVDLDTGAVVRTYFEEGYPGEIKWSPDGSRVAVSTYDVERTRHEVYIVDPATGDARHVSSGCVIVWSPDGRFLAQHIDHTPGVGIVDVETGAYGMITDVFGETPLWWEASPAGN
jgi:WD40 repeat protein